LHEAQVVAEPAAHVVQLAAVHACPSAPAVSIAATMTESSAAVGARRQGRLCRPICWRWHRGGLMRRNGGLHAAPDGRAHGRGGTRGRPRAAAAAAASSRVSFSLPACALAPRVPATGPSHLNERTAGGCCSRSIAVFRNLYGGRTPQRLGRDRNGGEAGRKAPGRRRK
jgi:hypothetical protein